MDDIQGYARQNVAFEDERTRPLRDLIAAIPTVEVYSAIDLGCGTGDATEILARRYPAARIAGLDSSEEKISIAKRRMPEVDFEVAAVEHWRSTAPVDLILANASLQHVPDQQALYTNLIGQLVPGGTLAALIPDNVDEPGRRAIVDMANSPAWRAKLGDVVEQPHRNADWYYALLREQTIRFEVWRTTYYHALRGGLDGVAGWFKGSALRPYLACLNPQEQVAFMAEYREMIAKSYTEFDDGVALLPFPRLFIMATR